MEGLGKLSSLMAIVPRALVLALIATLPGVIVALVLAWAVAARSDVPIGRVERLLGWAERLILANHRRPS